MFERLHFMLGGSILAIATTGVIAYWSFSLVLAGTRYEVAAGVIGAAWAYAYSKRFDGGTQI